MSKEETYGLILFEWDGKSDPSTVQLLTIMRRCSYPFGDFVNGRYNPKSPTFEADMCHRFGLMTAEEKSFVASMNFSIMYHKYWLTCPETSVVSPEDLRLYRKRKEMFKRTFLDEDAGARLQSWLNRTHHLEFFDLWEFPKGRQYQQSETPLQTAVRETKEETNIHEDLYNIVSIDPLYHRYIGADDHVAYGRTYYFGRMKPSVRLHMNVNHSLHSQRLEVSQIMWIELRTLERHLSIYNNIYQRIRTYCITQQMNEASL